MKEALCRVSRFRKHNATRPLKCIQSEARKHELRNNIGGYVDSARSLGRTNDLNWSETLVK